MPDPPAPRSVKIELTGRCNYKCGFCALRTRGRQPKRADDMKLAFFKRITREMHAAGVVEIGLFYLGEPLMSANLTVEACDYLKNELGMPYVFLTTNGSLATDEVLQRLMAAGLDSLKFSINACDDTQFAEIMGVKPSLYTKALQAVRSARRIRDENGYTTRLYASSIQYDGEQEQRMAALVAAHVAPFVDEHYYLPLYSMGAVATEREEELGYRPTAGNQGRIGGLVAPLPCWSAFTEGHVRHDGQMSLCCFDADGRFRVGDLHEHSFMEIWHSAKFQAVRRAHLGKDVSGTVCEDCVAYG
ncbi:MAG: radical SAM protein [Gammaproteobacteria bacterium]|nr:radical SAM protein [Gammaproteobacteria bacterium]